MLKILRTVLVFTAVLALGAIARPAWAANPATITVTVTIQNLSVSTSSGIAFGTVTTSSTTTAPDSSIVTNNGNVTETFSLSVTNQAPWVAVQAAPSVAEEYALLALFNTVQPVNGDFGYANHALTTSSVASSGTKFAGTQTGLSVVAGATRLLWLRFDAPTSTAVTTQQSFPVTVTASAG